MPPRSRTPAPGSARPGRDERSAPPREAAAAPVAAHPAALLQRARLAPASLTPAHLLQLQRTVGNAAVGRLLRAGPGDVQRYQRIASADYTAGGKARFPSQALQVDGAQARYTQTNAAAPGLKVATDATLAIEDTARQARVFFADAELIERSNVALEDAESAVRLVKGGKKKRIRVPPDPRNPAAEAAPVTLETVTWRPARADQNQVAAVSVCSDVASLVAGGISRPGAHVVLDDYTEREDGRPTYGTETGLSFNNVRKVAAYQAMQPDPGAAGFAAANQAHEAVVGNRAHYDAAFREELEGGMLHPDAVTYVARLQAPTPEVIRALKARVRQAYQAKPLPRTAVTEEEFSAILDLAYGSQPAQQATERSQAMGINAYAMPEVGEAYVTFPVGARDHTGRGPAFERHVQRLQNLGQQVDRAQEALRGVEVRGGWTWHAAAVVATSGDGRDRVTLENFNRDPEKDDTRERVFLSLRQRFEAFDKYVEGELGEARAASPQDVSRLVAGAAEALRGAGLAVQVAVDEAVESFARLDRTSGGDLWYFAMYGPPDETVGGAEVDQSFHQAMTDTGDFANPLTLRVRGDKTSARVRHEVQADANLAKAQRCITAILNATLGVAVLTKASVEALRDEAQAALDAALDEANAGRRSERLGFLEATMAVQEDLDAVKPLVNQYLTRVI